MTLRLGLRFAVEPGEEAFYPSVAATLLDAAAVFPLEEGTAGLETMPRALCAAWAVERDRADVLAARHMLAHTQAGARRAGTPDACLDAMRQDLVSRYPFRDMEGFRRWGESVPPPIAMSDAAWELLFWSQFDQGEIYQALGTVMLLANERGWPKQSPYACRLLGLAADPVAEQGMPERAALLWLEAADCELSYPADLVTARSALAEANALRSEVQDPNLLARLDFANAQMSFFFGGMAGAVRSIDRWLREQPDADDGDMLEGIVVGCVAEALGGGTFNAPDDRLRSVSRGEVPANVLPMLVLLERARRDGQISDRSWRALSRYLETGRPRALVCACGDGR